MLQQRPFRQHLLGRGLAESTSAEYAAVIGRANRWLVANLGVELAAAAPHQVRAWADQLAPSWSTRKNARTALGHWQQWAHHPHDLAAAVRVPRKPRMTTRALTDEQAIALEQAAHEAGRRGLAVLLGLYLGMRVSEIARASWTGYDGTHWTWTRAKTGDVATLPVAPRLTTALDREPRHGPFLFPSGINPSRPHVAPQTVWQWCRDIGETVGIGLSTHQLRHTSISRVVETMGIRVGQEWAGHRDPEVTAGYSRVKERQLTAAAEALGGLFDGDSVTRSVA